MFKNKAMLYTNLKHIETTADHAKIIGENENVMIVCGRMESSSILIYRIVEELEKQYPHVRFFDIEFDNPESNVFKVALDYYKITDVPIVCCFKNGEMVNVLFGCKTEEEVKAILDKEFSATVSA
jgi:thioredoxin 1